MDKQTNGVLTNRKTLCEGYEFVGKTGAVSFRIMAKRRRNPLHSVVYLASFGIIELILIGKQATIVSCKAHMFVISKNFRNILIKDITYYHDLILYHHLQNSPLERAHTDSRVSATLKCIVEAFLR